MDVLISGTMGTLGSVVRSNLESHGLQVGIFEIAQNTFRDQFGYHRGLMKALAADSPRMVMPVGNQIALSRYNLPEGVIAPIETEEKLRILESKLGATKIAASLGVLQPTFYNCSSDVPEGLQVVFKRDISYGGHGVHLPWNRQSLDNLISREKPGTYLIQDWIEGEDYSVDVLRWHGFYFAGSYKVLDHHGNGPSRKRESAVFPEMESAARKIMEHMDYNGVCGFDFRVSAQDGKAYFLECNPRFSGGLESQIASGFEIPWLLWRLAVGESVSPSEIEFRPGIVTESSIYGGKSRI